MTRFLLREVKENLEVTVRFVHISSIKVGEKNILETKQSPHNLIDLHALSNQTKEQL